MNRIHQNYLARYYDLFCVTNCFENERIIYVLRFTDHVSSPMLSEHAFLYLNRLISRRWTLVLSLLVITALGFASKFYSGPRAWWFNNYLAGLLYEVFWCLIGIVFCPRAKPHWIALWVFGITCFLEALQLWHPQFLELIRSTFIGAALIGTTFSWWDFFYYVIGSAIGWFWIGRFSES